MTENPDPGKKPHWTTPSGIALLAFGAIGAFLLIAEHRVHALGLLPFLILLACPLLHFFMHRGHGGHGGHHGGGTHSGGSPGSTPRARLGLEDAATVVPTEAIPDSSDADARRNPGQSDAA